MTHNKNYHLWVIRLAIDELFQKLKLRKVFLYKFILKSGTDVGVVPNWLGYEIGCTMTSTAACINY